MTHTTTISDEEFRRIYAETKTIAVVGISMDPEKASYKVAQFLREQGYRVIPVNPRGGEWQDEHVHTSLAEVDHPIDLVDVFRPAEEAPGIAREAAAAGAKTLWLQLDIVSDEAAQIAADAGMTVVMDRCMKVELERLRETAAE
jgi:predicted CoA-binding protein